VAIVSAVPFYARHRRARPDPGRHLSPIAYGVVLIVGAIVAFPVGVGLGIQWGCSGPSSDNLCGLRGFLVGGPFASALAIFVVGGLIALLPPDQ
jgi:hypothetical protein